MALLSVTIDDPTPAFQALHSEVAFIKMALEVVANELVRSQGNVTSGSIVGTTPTGASGSLGSWTYTPVATNP